jgi:hypothetical protein
MLDEVLFDYFCNTKLSESFDSSLEQREYSNTLQAGEVFRKEYTITIE